MKNVSDKRLVVLNPFLVTGPSLTKIINPSVGTFVDMFNGKVPAMANLSLGFVDVRDVAWAHILALTNPNAKGCHILCNEVQSMQQVVETSHKISQREISSLVHCAKFSCEACVVF
ncbi:hypothetical protein AC1031_018112 [Aphanomyces cochlioides]|nr:hypothetical protein AC1031_018112 [Aphanomyces cochlioides]